MDTAHSEKMTHDQALAEIKRLDSVVERLSVANGYLENENADLKHQVETIKQALSASTTPPKGGSFEKGGCRSD